VSPTSTRFSEALRVAQVEHAHAAPRDLVLVRRADPAPGRPDRLARRALRVDELVMREHEVRALAHVQPPLDVDAVAHQLVDLVEQRVRVEHDAVADGAPHAGVQDPARDLVQHERPLADVDRVPRVRAALVPHHPVGALGEHVHQLPLPLVAPLGADHHEGARRRIEHELPGDPAWGRSTHEKTPRGRGVGEI
jgi:hypothetical protein